MQEFLRIVEEPRQCSYLPRETASLELRGILNISPEEYQDLLTRGYRRIGWQLFRPACAACSECRSLRVPIPKFVATGAQRRILRQNRSVRAELHPLFATPEIVELYNIYHRFAQQKKNWPPQRASLGSYSEMFLSGAAALGRQWLYFDEDRLVGVALMDETPGAISLVYCFYHPDWRPRSPGTFSILNQLLYARKQSLEYAYLGYRIAACPSMAYKARFRPHEILRRYPADDEAPLWEFTT
jgi:arginyl-tRNA--protein-N-Asp/Glu arginylyltransferase